jgi:riboflavin kinase/FMN adenylyltransferase
MELIRGLRALRPIHRGSVVTIGGFDGIHLGHQALLKRLLDHGQQLSRKTMMLTFEPLPREHLAVANPPARITSWRERWRLLETTDLDAMWLIRFCAGVRNLTGEQFMRLLSEDLQTPLVVVGHDFRFGREGDSTVPKLEEAGRRMGFTVDVVPPILVDGERVSSSGIRAALDRGELKRAERWLGRPYSMRGRVIRGERLGHQLGYPTANLRLERRRTPLAGIFAVRVRGIASDPLPGVASLGTRPTVNGVEPLLEAHVFDFSGDLYGREIEVEFVEKLRDEARFDSLEALVEQMHLDAASARRVLGI